MSYPLASDQFCAFKFSNLENAFKSIFINRSYPNVETEKSKDSITLYSLNEEKILQFNRLSENYFSLEFEVVCMKNINTSPEKAVTLFNLLPCLNPPGENEFVRDQNRFKYFTFEGHNIKESDLISIIEEALLKFFGMHFTNKYTQKDLEEAVMMSKIRQELNKPSSNPSKITTPTTNTRAQEPVGMTIFFIVLMALALLGICKLVGC